MMFAPVLLVYFILATVADDFAIAINESAIVKIQVPLGPMVQTWIMDDVQIKVKPIGIDDTVSVIIDPLIFLDIEPGGFSLTTNASSGTIDVHINQLDVLLNTTNVHVEVPAGFGNTIVNAI